MELNKLFAPLGCADSTPIPALVHEVPQLEDNGQELFQVSLRNPSFTRNPIWSQPSAPSQGSSPIPLCCTDLPNMTFDPHLLVWWIVK